MQSFKNAWNQAVVKLTECIPGAAVNLWIKPIYPVDIYNNEAVIYVKNNFTRDVIIQRYATQIEASLEEVLGFEIKLCIYTAEDNPKDVPIKLPKVFDDDYSEDEEAEQEEIFKPETSEKSYTYYTFDNFIVGSSNTFAHAACVAVSKRPGSIYNPLFIYGDSGLGKTHLLNAIRNKLESDYEGAKIIYLKCDDFVNDMVRALQNGTMNEFKDKYRQADVLLVDDIQFISKSESFQEEFFHTFNALYESGKQIILTSDRTPKEIPLLTERLRTRFESGLIADIQSPDYELRVAIIRKKIEPYKMAMSEDIVFFLAEKLKNNVRQLEGVIKKLMAFYDLTNTVPSLSLAQDALTEIMNENIPVSIMIDKVLVETSRYFEVSVDDLKSKKRTAKIANARQIGMYVLSQVSDLSLGEIGKEFGDKDHSTVHHSIKVVEDNRNTNSRIKQSIEEIIANVRNR